MSDLTQADIRARLDDLAKGWIGEPSRGDVNAAAATFAEIVKYVPYMLATIYYSIGLYAKMPKSTKDGLWHARGEFQSDKLNTLVDEIVERVLQFTPEGSLGKAECRSDLRAVVEGMASIASRDKALAIELISERLFDTLKNLNPSVGAREHRLVRYIVKTEISRSSG